MGCHTWFYMKMKKQPSHEYIKKVCLKSFKKNWLPYADLIFHKYDVSKCTEATQNDVKKYDWTFEYILNGNEENRRNMEAQFLEAMASYRNLRHKNIIDDWMMDYFCNVWTPPSWPKTKYPHLEYHNGEFYQECDENYETILHNVFRVYDYPEVVLHNYDEYVEFVNNPKNNARLNGSPDATWEKANKQMKWFWDKFPDGIVRFG